MNLTPDALQLGPLVLAWDRLTLLLALGTWLGTAHVRQAGTAALVTLVAARLAAALPHWFELAATFGGRLLTVLDVRAGDWAWPVGVMAGLVYLLKRLRGWPSALTRGLVLTASATVLPLLIRPAPSPALNAEHVTVTRVSSEGKTTPLPFADLPLPAVVNVWATWCGPCRAALPVLARALAAGGPVVLINAGEDPAQVRAFLDSLGVRAPTFVDGGELRQALQISGYPSTLVIGRTGQVAARHQGPVDAPQLQALLGEARALAALPQNVP